MISVLYVKNNHLYAYKLSFIYFYIFSHGYYFFYFELLIKNDCPYNYNNNPDISKKHKLMNRSRYNLKNKKNKKSVWIKQFNNGTYLKREYKNQC